MTRRAKAIGQRGSWFAEIDGQKYACVHKHWFKSGLYHDPELRAGDKRSDTFVASLIEKEAAILTDDLTSQPDEGGPLSFRRKSYIALWSIADLSFDEAGLRFRFVARLAEL